jgi:hypothetical protein
MRGETVLVESGRAHRMVDTGEGGVRLRAERRLRTPDGSLRFAVRTGEDGLPSAVRIVRENGPVGDPVRVRARDLPALAAAIARWMATRTEWWAFEASASGSVAGYAGARLTVQAPGADSPEVRVGRRRMGAMIEGRDFTGTPEEHALAAPIALAAGAVQTATRVRVGERAVTVNGAPDLPEAPPPVAVVGAVYTCGACSVHALRGEAVVHTADGRSVYVYPHEARVFEALVALPPLSD